MQAKQTNMTLFHSAAAALLDSAPLSELSLVFHFWSKSPRCVWNYHDDVVYVTHTECRTWRRRRTGCSGRVFLSHRERRSRMRSQRPNSCPDLWEAPKLCLLRTATLNEHETRNKELPLDSGGDLVSHLVLSQKQVPGCIPGWICVVEKGQFLSHIWRVGMGSPYSEARNRSKRNSDARWGDEGGGGGGGSSHVGLFNTNFISAVSTNPTNWSSVFPRLSGGSALTKSLWKRMSEMPKPIRGRGLTPAIFQALCGTSSLFAACLKTRGIIRDNYCAYTFLKE